MRPLVVLAVALASPALVAASPCRRYGLAPDVLTPTGAKIAHGGGVLVAAKQIADTGRDEASQQPNWHFQIAGHAIEPVRTVLAPGLTLYALPAGATAATLEDEAHTRHAEIVDGGDVKLLAAPEPKGARYVANMGRRGPTTTVFVDLPDKPPASAIAIVAYGSDGVARDWSPTSGDTSYVVSYTGNSCNAPKPKQVASGPGDKLTFAWIDASGRPSAMSAAITVKP